MQLLAPIGALYVTIRQNLIGSTYPTHNFGFFTLQCHNSHYRSLQCNTNATRTNSLERTLIPRCPCHHRCIWSDNCNYIKVVCDRQRPVKFCRGIPEWASPSSIDFYNHHFHSAQPLKEANLEPKHFCYGQKVYFVCMTGGIIDTTEHNIIIITPGIVIIICCLGLTAGIPLISDAEWYQSRWHNKNDGSTALGLCRENARLLGHPPRAFSHSCFKEEWWPKPCRDEL